MRMNSVENTAKLLDKNQDSTAESILDAALQLYLEFGLRRTTMDDVARRIKMTRVTIYRYYADKSALFIAVVHREWMRSVAGIDRQTVDITDPELRFVERFVLSIDGTRNHPLIRRLFESDTEWLLPYLTVKAEVTFKFATLVMTNTLKESQQQGFFTHLDAGYTAELIVRLSQSIILTSGGLLAPASPEALRDVATRFLLPLLRGNQQEI